MGYHKYYPKIHANEAVCGKYSSKPQGQAQDSEGPAWEFQVEKLRQLILIEEFKRRIPFHMKTVIDEKQEENLQEAAALADEYFLTHGNFNQQRNQSSDKQYTANPSSGSDSFQQPVNSTQSMKSNSETSAPFCNYCKRRGHLKSECFYLAGKQLSRPDVQQPSPSGHIVPNAACF